MKTWFTIKALADDSAEISIFDEIGMWGVSAKDFINDFRKVNAQKVNAQKVTLLINSPGGSVFDGLAIYNVLRQSKADITVRVMGVAASAASFIAMAGKKIVMPKNSFMMVHNPMAVAIGNADEMREWADTLDKIAASLVGIYTARTGKSEDEIKALLDAETWMTADEAVELGFADEVEPEMRMTALFETERLPENIRAAFVPAEPASQSVQEPSATLAEQIEVLAKAAGFSDYAPVFAVNAVSIEDAKKSIDAAREIRSLCCVAKMADKADGFIRARKSVNDVRESLLTAMAERDENTHTDTAARNPSSPAPITQPAALNVTDVWAARRKLKGN
jgi:ATP-dependent Clp protease protease subunit